jgi:small subunit ribosomal protein S5
LSGLARGRSGRRPVQEKPWVPQTALGKKVAEGRITSLGEIFEQNLKIREPEIVEKLLPGITSELIDISRVQKQTDAGRFSRFRAIVAVGNHDGWFGIGEGKDADRFSSMDKATDAALLTIIPVKRGCGSLECADKSDHSIPFMTKGKAGSATVQLLPAARGVGLVAGPSVKKLLGLAGIKDVYVRTFGSTRTSSSLAKAVYDALVKAHGQSS